MNTRIPEHLRKGLRDQFEVPEDLPSPIKGALKNLRSSDDQNKAGDNARRRKDCRKSPKKSKRADK